MGNVITDNIDVWTSAIKPKAAAGRGRSSKQELYGIKKLRELILELAVRGLLVEQDAGDEPAAVLLEKIAKEKSRLVKEGMLKKQKALPAIPEEEKPFEVPDGWEWVRFGTISIHNAGKTLDSGRNKGDLRKYLTTSNLYWGRFDLSEVREMPILESEIEKCKATKGDLLICEGGEAGRSAVWEEDYDVCFQNHVHRARFYGGVNPYYAFRLMQKLDFTGEINLYRKGVAISNLSGKALSSITFPLPPLNEQTRIVNKVNELMTLCDHLEQQSEKSLSAHNTLVETLLVALTNAPDHAGFSKAWQRIAEHFDTLFTTEQSIDQLQQTILQLAVMGKLVEQDPNDEPASVLLEKIAAEKAKLVKEKKIKKQKKLPDQDFSSYQSITPRHWEWVSLGDLVSIMDAGWSPACPPDPSPSNDVWGVLKTTAVQVMKYLEHENKALAQGKDPKPQYEVNAGDILITRAGPKNRVAISCLVETTRPKLMISDKIIRFHLVEVGIYERYISLCLNAGITADYLENAKSGMAESQMNISQDKLRLAPIPLCPINEQHRIITKVDELSTLCEELKSHLSTAQTTQLQLADAITDQAIAS